MKLHDINHIIGTGLFLFLVVYVWYTVRETIRAYREGGEDEPAHTHRADRRSRHS
jgi:hypothetical protein